MNHFRAADILMPKTGDLEKWAVVACDQYTSQPEYWERVDALVGDAPSTLRMILPEAWMNAEKNDENIAAINRKMEEYLSGDVFTLLKDSYVYVERTLLDGRVRRGLVGMVDLEAYDWRKGSTTPIRATEGTVAERLPLRVRIRENAPLELPHILMLANDPADDLLAPLVAFVAEHTPLYTVELMEHSGHLAGWRICGEQARALDARISAYEASTALPYAVGDGNHSLAAARSCWEAIRGTVPMDHPARYALVELENIHDPALAFEPIHRIVTDVDPDALLQALEPWCAPDGEAVEWVIGARHGTIRLDRSRSTLAVGTLQAFLDQYGHGTVDYIHGDETVAELAQQPNAIAFLLPPMDKAQMFEGVENDGALPRKTFSMGHAAEKRFYLEGRCIR